MHLSPFELHMGKRGDPESLEPPPWDRNGEDFDKFVDGEIVLVEQ